MRSRFFYLHLIFWIGFTALIYEIYSIHVLFLFIVETTRAAALAISSFLAGLACSSLVSTRIQKTAGRQARERLLVGMQLLVAIYAWAILTRYDWIPSMSDFIDAHVPENGLAAFARAAVVWIYLFVPAFFIGGAFPIVNGLYLQPHSDATADTGSVYFWDVLGSIFGALLAGFYLLPKLGLRSTVILPMLINLLLAILLIREHTPRVVLLAVILALSGYEVYERRSGVIKDLTFHFSGEDKLERRFGAVIFQEPSPYGRITVGRDPRRSDRKTLFINYRDMCHSEAHNSETRMASIVNQLLEPQSSVMNIGLGCGFTASELAAHPAVAKLRIVEINPVVAKASRDFFRAENNGVQENPKTTLTLVDGARFLRTHDEMFDAILVDIEDVTVMYSSPLFTREYVDIIKKRLKPRGIFALWSFNAGRPMSKVLLNTIRAVFENVRIRILERAVVFFASERSLTPITADEEPEKTAVAEIEGTSVREINTLDRRVLENHYNIRAIFGFPTHYQEPFVRDPAQIAQ